jgi:hypothetical protein
MGELEDGICLYGTRESMWSITLLGKSGNTDISHMGRLRVKGKDAEELLQRTTTVNILETRNLENEDRVHLQ